MDHKVWLIWIVLIFWGSSVFSDTLSISSNPATFTVNSAVAGQQPPSVTNTSTNYNVTTTTGAKKSISGNINSALPSGVTLQIQLTAPSGATSVGLVSMTTTAQSLVTNIPGFTTATGLTVTYQFTATVSAAQATNATRTLTLTLD